MKRVIWGCGVAVLLLSTAGCKSLINPPGSEAEIPGGSTGAASTKPSSRVPAVTRDNFVSLSLHTSGGIAGLESHLTVYRSTLSFSSGRPMSGGVGGFGEQPGKPAPSTVGLSASQLDALLRVLNDARFPALAGQYRQDNLADGFNEVLVLTLSDGRHKDQTFRVENYGENAPPAYYMVTAFLRQLQQQKFAPPEPPKMETPQMETPQLEPAPTESEQLKQTP